MTHIETVAAQRDDLAMKLRKAIQERDAALAEVARLKAASSAALPGVMHGEVPAVTPQLSKRPRIFGGKGS